MELDCTNLAGRHFDVNLCESFLCVREQQVPHMSDILVVCQQGSGERLVAALLVNKLLLSLVKAMPRVMPKLIN